MSDTKNMHFNPETCLKKFGFGKSNRKIHKLSRQFQHKPYSTVDVAQVCYSPHLYALPGDTVEQRMLIEHAYKKYFEDEFDTLYNYLTTPGRVMIEPEWRRKVVLWVCSMLLRNPKTTEGVDWMTEQTAKVGYHLSKENGHDYYFEGEQKISIAGKTWEEFRAEQKLKTRISAAIFNFKMIYELAEARLANDMICVIRNRADLHMLTSDNPVWIHRPDRTSTGLADPSNILRVPIDPRTMIELRPNSEDLDLGILYHFSNLKIVEESMIHTYNCQQMYQCGGYVLGTKKGMEGLQSYLKAKGLTIEAPRPIKYSFGHSLG